MGKLYISAKERLTMRKETDFLGTESLPDDALYGIHAWRARENFDNLTHFSTTWYRAVGLTKKACYLTYKQFKQAAQKRYPLHDLPLRWIPDDKLHALTQAAEEVASGQHREEFIVPAVQGGAGTSINMNANEIITNRALQIMGHQPGQYQHLDPVEDANIYQSTNDVIPTALTVAAMELLTELEESINALRQSVEEKETHYRNYLRLGYTQLQAAVPTSFGQLFSNYSDALSRDWWRISKCFERIKVVNLGGSAIGTGLTVPRYFIMEVVNQLQRLTQQPITRGENLSDATSNLDRLVEVHGILKAHAVNLEKMANDLRLLSADIAGNKQLALPARQAGSSIMPGKVNPVIPEYIISVAHRVYANDQLISSLSGQGMLELNAYLPVIGHHLLDSLQLLIAANESLYSRLFQDLTVLPAEAEQQLYRSARVATALLPHIGYHKAGELARYMNNQQTDIWEANRQLQLISEDKLKALLQPEQLVKLGFSLQDIV